MAGPLAFPAVMIAKGTRPKASGIVRSRWQSRESLNCSCRSVLALIRFGRLVFCLCVYKLFKSRLVHFNFCGFLEVMPSLIANILFSVWAVKRLKRSPRTFLSQISPRLCCSAAKSFHFFGVVNKLLVEKSKTWINFPMSAPGNCGGVQLAVAVVSMELHS